MKKSILVIVACVLLSVSTILGGELRQTMTFSPQDRSFKKQLGYDQVRMKGLSIAYKSGAPELPLASAAVSIPAEMEAISVKVISVEKKVIPGKYRIYPSQPPLPISSGPVEFVEPDSAIYSSSQPYPGKIVELTGCGSLGGYKLADLLVYPLQYLPTKGSLIFYTKIEFSLELVPSPSSLKVRARGEKAQRFYEQLVKDLVINPSELPFPPGKAPPFSQSFEYLIVTSPSLRPAFQPLTDWKMQKGIPAAIRSISWIRENYWGNDDAAKLRNYLRIAYQDSGLVWVLLGGDVEVVPCRKAWVNAGGYADTLPCDQYYSDLDGSWDENENLIYGEPDDEVDMYPDVFVGRASASSLQEAETFVGKVLEYEKNPPLDYQLKMLFLAGTLWDDPNPYTPGGEAKDMIGYLVPSRFSITKLYDDHDNHDLSPASAIAAMNDGYNIINHNDHANWNVLRMGSLGGIVNQDMDTLSNLHRWSIFYSGGCISAAFDFSDCIAEHFINNSQGGGVGYIGNSRYGFGTPGDPGGGPSDQYDFEFFASLFTGHYNLGVANAESKSRLVPISQTDRYMRWCQYELNLLGDPEMPVWTDTPESLTVAYPQTIPLRPCTLSIEVTSSGKPISNATVSLLQDGNPIEVGYTDLSGNLSLRFSPHSTNPLKITIAAHNCLPFQGEITVIPVNPFVYCQGYEIDDDTLGGSWGNGDGTVNPGERIELRTTAKNPGNEQAVNVWGKLLTDEPVVTMLDSLAIFGDIPAGSLTVGDPFRFQVAPACTNRQILNFTLEFSDQDAHVWEEDLDLKVFSPIFFVKGTAIEDTGGNGNGAFEPEETVNLYLTLENSGSQEAVDIAAILHTDAPHITILDSVSSFGNIPIWRRGDNSTHPFVLKTDAEQPEDVEVQFSLYLQSSEGLKDTISFPLRIGLPRFEWADHNVGNLIFTVTGYGSVGFTFNFNRGHGFIYPKEGENYLFYGALAAGTAPDYLVDRFYDESGGATHIDWVTTDDPDGRLKLGDVAYSNQDGWAQYDDSGHPFPKGLTVVQNSWAWADSPYNDFVILDYTFLNQASNDIEGLYVGQFMDYDLVDAQSNDGRTDEVRRLAYMYYDPETPIMGIKLLYPKVAANLSLIDHAIYVYQGTTEEMKYGFLNGSLHQDSSNRTFDWSAVVSAGPFNLPPEGNQRVAFAVLGGRDIIDLEFNADQAQALYDSLMTGITGRRETELPTSYNLYPNYPNPFNPSTKITYSLPKAGEVNLTIYNILGQKVATLVDGNRRAGRRSIRWDAKGLSSGIYLCRLKAGDYSMTIKMILLK